MTGPLILDSLRRRMRAMHSLYEQAVTSMGPEHVNHVERDGVLIRRDADLGRRLASSYPAYLEYQLEVFRRTETFLDTMDAADLNRVLVARPFPPQIASTYQHGPRHMGEIEHGRALVGLGGMPS